VFVAQGRAGLFAAYRTSKLDHNRTLDARNFIFGSAGSRWLQKYPVWHSAGGLSARRAPFVI
jgi:hypothetical protein